MKKKETIQLIITGILVVVLVILVIQGQARIKKIKNPPKKNVSAGAGVPAPVIPTTGLYARLEEETKSLQILRDPFSKKPAESSTTATRDLILSGIFRNKGNPAAIINNQVLTIGEEVEGNMIMDIKENRVILNDGQRNFELRME